MLQGYISSLENMQTNDESIRQEVENYKKELLAFGESRNDATTFFSEFQESGLMEKFMNITTKITQSAQAGQEANKEASTEKHIPTPAEWLAPFRTAYDHIKNLPIRERGLAVYRRLFEIGEKHTYITEFLAEVERENLLWKICSEDTLGILEITLSGMDPLYKGLTYPLLKNIEAWNSSVCEADAYYLQDILSEDIAKNSARILQKELFVICLGLNIMIYRGPKGKEGIMEMIATGNCPKPAFTGCASNMVIGKMQTKRTLDIIKKALGLSFDDIISDEFLKYKLISTANVCGLSKAYVQSNANLLEIIADTVHNEIIPDISLMDAIKREAALSFGRWRMPDEADAKTAKEIALKNCQHLPYFKYEEQLKGQSFHIGVGEGFEIKPVG